MVFKGEIDPKSMCAICGGKIHGSLLALNIDYCGMCMKKLDDYEPQKKAIYGFQRLRLEKLQRADRISGR